MNVDDCITFANSNPVCYIATQDGDQPRVRGMLMWYADKSGLYFNTGAMKQLYEQLQTNPKVEVCFFDPKSKSMTQMRVIGQVEILNDPELKKKLVEARPFLRQMGYSAESPNLIMFRVAKCTAHFWTMETNLEPKPHFSFG